jgi:hypothetical protein
MVPVGRSTVVDVVGSGADAEASGASPSSSPHAAKVATSTIAASAIGARRRR